jgi:hypothetical protein
MQVRLAVRIDAANPDHHLWNNHGTWWIHYTLELDSWRTKRVRRSLGTSDVSVARELRDAAFESLPGFPVGGSL